MHESIKPAFKRLFDAQAHWHNANKEYFTPNLFRMAINSCIQELRNVTFVLQSNKRSIDGFDAWYKPWQERMRANKSLKWLISARNHIVKQGDLELNSMLRIEIIGSYLENEVPIFEHKYEPNLTNQDIFQEILNTDLPQEVFEQAYIKLERKWIDKNYPEYELLKLLGICWSEVAELLLDAPNPELDSEKEYLKGTKIPPCMYLSSESHSIWMKIRNNELIPTEIIEEPIDLNDSNIEDIKNRYGNSPLLQKRKNSTNFKEICELFFEQAKYVLKKDGYHVNLVAIFVNSELAELKELRNEDQTDKYRAMRLLASDVEKIGATEFVMVSEAWTAPFDPKFPYRPAVESPDRSEVLNLIGISKAEENYLFSIPFTNNEGKIELGESDCRGVEGINIIQPILSVWKN